MDSAGENRPLPSSTVSIEDITAALSRTCSVEECLTLAAAAENLGNTDLQRQCLEHAIAFDRNCQTALLILAGSRFEENDRVSTAVLLEESARVSSLPPEVEPLRAALMAELEQQHQCDVYLQAIGRQPAPPPLEPLTVLLVTNLFPPQELGGYGRMMWEFANGLAARGHRLRVLTSDEAKFAKPPTSDEVALESCVARTLKLAGTWVEGKGSILSDRSEIAQAVRDNTARVRTAVTKLKPDLVLAGNLDLLGVSILQPALDAKVPVLHALANAAPGYAPHEQPVEAHYWVAPCSAWNGEAFKQGGFSVPRVETLYPGARIDRFFRFFLPDTRRLRICYASLVMPYKGADTLVQALAELHAAGVNFTAEIAGDTPDRGFLAQLKQIVATAGMESKVHFTGFLDRHGLSALFARSNVLVFPSRFDEPFGISQVEALAAGLVVVSSGTGGAKEIVRDEQDGLLFPAGDAKTLAGQLARLDQDQELFSRLQRYGQARSAAFSVEKAVLRIESLAAEMKAELAAAAAAEAETLASSN